MKRRTAIGRIVLAGVVGAGAFSGYKWYEWNRTPDMDYLDRRRATLAALVQTILPPSPTIPGAADAGVHDYIIRYVKDCVDAHTANTFIDGLKDVAHYSRSHFNKEYEACTPEEQTSILQHFEEKGRPFNGVLGKAETKFLGPAFFPLLREYTVRGYCTSEAGATKGLTYVPVPGSFHGCIPKTPGQRAWATK
ncbi:gluconate 2-dehydrogenase subunit 3 family protein [Puia dinghuensis]|uniref:Twin-arginine translocation pathway signal protein n=1 Tax=Puia dinghuensis TaxID=1792502 RepID=A0A8J2UH91_9BACT|nr:gluconate 2-dehydrogenase subunit 3 family protein [Puia dinghuensis]GGB16611.1 twin-arginine translocation pathway signal protein [Puia dinghuensis]